MFEKVVQFNFLPSDYLHETWLDLPQLSNLYCKLQGSLTLYQRSEVLFSLLKLDRTTVSFEDSFIYRRLALLERPVFDHLALKLGLIYLSPILKKNINGALIRSLRISLSEEEFQSINSSIGQQILQFGLFASQGGFLFAWDD